MVNAMRNDFLTIPEAPNYEINSQLMVRNRRTGKILKSYFYKTWGSTNVNLYVNKRYVVSDVDSLRKNAVAAYNDYWAAVPSLNDFYELNPKGILRDAKTKLCLTKCVDGGRKVYRVNINGVECVCGVKELLEEVYDISPAVRGVPVTLRHNKRAFKFDSLKTAARFLNERTEIKVGTLLGYLSQRVTEIGGWNIKYGIEQLCDV